MTVQNRSQEAFRQNASRPQTENTVIKVQLDGVIRATKPDELRPDVISMNVTGNMLSEVYEQADRLGSPIVIELNSGGGSGEEAQMLVKHMQALRAQYPNIPTVSLSIKGKAASAVNYILAEKTLGEPRVFDHVIADKDASMGSIGVVSEWMDPSDLYEENGVIMRRYTSGSQKRDLTMTDLETDIKMDHREMFREFKDLMIQRFGDNILGAEQAVRDVAKRLYMKQNEAPKIARKKLDFLLYIVEEAQKGISESTVDKDGQPVQIVDYRAMAEAYRAAPELEMNDQQIYAAILEMVQRSPIEALRGAYITMEKDLSFQFNLPEETMKQLEAEAQAYADNLDISESNWAEIEDILFNGGVWKAEHAKAFGFVDAVTDAGTDAYIQAAYGVNVSDIKTVTSTEYAMGRIGELLAIKELAAAKKAREAIHKDPELRDHMIAQIGVQQAGSNQPR